MRQLSAALVAIALIAPASSKLAAEETGRPADATAGAALPASGLEQIDKGRQIYAQHCSHCHGFNMHKSSPIVFDLRTFPHDDKARFVNSVTRGKNDRMPPWGDVLKSDEIDELWAYVQTGSKQ